MTGIEITDEKTIAQLQEELQLRFPFLKIEFYREPHIERQGNEESDRLDVSLTVGEARTKTNRGRLSIHGNQKVSTLESALHEIYGLNAQIFRKSGELWLQTTTTDDWTLSQQNDSAEEFSLTMS